MGESVRGREIELGERFNDRKGKGAQLDPRRWM